MRDWPGYISLLEELEQPEEEEEEEEERRPQTESCHR